MKKLKSGLFLFLLILFVSSSIHADDRGHKFFHLITKHKECSSEPISSARDKIEATVEKYMELWSMGDSAGVAALYSNNSQLFVPAVTEPFVGPDGAQVFVQGAIDAGISKIVLDSNDLEIFKGRGRAIDVGYYSLFVDGATDPVDTGPYIIIWKLKNGIWQLHRDILNSNVPTQ